MGTQSSIPQTTTIRRPWWWIRNPVLTFLLAAIFILQASFMWGDPDRDVIRTIAAIILPVLALGIITAATATLVIGRRVGDPSAEAGPLAQESDPRLRHTP